LSLASMAAVTDKIRSGPAASGHVIEDLCAKGMIICGGPGSVVQHHEADPKEDGVGKASLMKRVRTPPHRLTTENQELLARKVMPRLRHVGEDMPAPRVHAAE